MLLRRAASKHRPRWRASGASSVSTAAAGHGAAARRRRRRLPLVVVSHECASSWLGGAFQPPAGGGWLKRPALSAARSIFASRMGTNRRALARVISRAAATSGCIHSWMTWKGSAVAAVPTQSGHWRPRFAKRQVSGSLRFLRAPLPVLVTRQAGTPSGDSLSATAPRRMKARAPRWASLSGAVVSGRGHPPPRVTLQDMGVKGRVPRRLM